MASPIDAFGAATMDPASQFGAQTEPVLNAGDNPLEEITQDLGSISGIGTLGLLPSDGRLPVQQPTGQGIGVGGLTVGDQWRGGTPTGVMPGGDVPTGAAGPIGGDPTAGGGFSPVNNTQLEALFPTTNNPPIPVDPGGAGGRPEGGLFGNPIPVDPGGVNGQPEGGLFGGGGTIPVDPGGVGGRPEGGLLGGGPIGPVVTGTPPPENPFGNNPNPLNLPPLPPGFVNPGGNFQGGPIPVDPNPVGGRPEGGIGPLVGPQPSNALAQLPPDVIRRLLALLAARQNRTA